MRTAASVIIAQRRRSKMEHYCYKCKWKDLCGNGWGCDDDDIMHYIEEER